MNRVLANLVLNTCALMIFFTQTVSADIYLLTSKPTKEESQKICHRDEIAVVRHEAGAGHYHYEVLYCKGINRTPTFSEYDSTFSEYTDFQQEMTKVAKDFSAKLTPYEKKQLGTLRGILNFFIFSHDGLVQDSTRGPHIDCVNKCQLFADTTTENLGSNIDHGEATLWTCKPSEKNIFCVTNLSGPSDWKPFRECKNQHGKIKCTANEKKFDSYSTFFHWKISTQDVRVVFETTKPKRLFSQRLRNPIIPLYNCEDIRSITEENYQQCDVEKI